MNNEGKLIVISGPSGSGKDTLLAEILKDERYVHSVSATTRQKREYETDGKEYFFVSREEFEKKISENGFLEYAEYNGNLYGTPLDFVKKSIAEGKNVVLVIEVKGAMQIKRLFPEAMLVFLAPEGISELYHRLSERGTETDEVIEKRVGIAKFEIGFAKEYDFIITNRRGKLDEALKDFLAASDIYFLTSKYKFSSLCKAFEL